MGKILQIMTWNNKLLCGLFYIFVICGSFITATGQCFEVDQPITELILEPGAVKKGEITIRNIDKPREISLEVTLEEFYNSDAAAKGKKVFNKRWISIAPSKLVIPINESRKCNYRIELPQTASGEYKVNVFFKEILQENTQSQIGIGFRFGAVIYAVVKDTQVIKGGIKKIQLLGSMPGRFGVTIRNDGNVHTRPKGILIVKNRKTEESFTIDFNQKQSPVLPYSEEEISGISSRNLEPGIYSVSAEIDYGHEYNEKTIKLIKREIFKIYNVPKQPQKR